jgi:hypothetical protein
MSSGYPTHPGGTAMPALAMVATVTPVRGHAALTQSVMLRQKRDRESLPTGSRARPPCLDRAEPPGPALT